MYNKKNHVGRPTNEEVAVRKSNKIASIAIVLSLITIILSIFMISFYELNISNLKGSSNKRRFYYYSSSDKRWGSIKWCGTNRRIREEGSGITSMAMILATLKNDSTITPIATMNEAYKAGYCGYNIMGTDFRYFEYSASKHRLVYKNLKSNSDAIKKIRSELGNGGLVIANVNSKSPFTNYESYVVIYKNGSNGKVYVADPYHSKKKQYNLSDFVNKGWIQAGWAVIKKDNNKLTLDCPTTAYVGKEFTCYTNMSGAKITVTASGLANGYNTSFTTTKSDKTKQSKYITSGLKIIKVSKPGYETVSNIVLVRNK